MTSPDEPTAPAPTPFAPPPREPSLTERVQAALGEEFPAPPADIESVETPPPVAEWPVPPPVAQPPMPYEVAPPAEAAPVEELVAPEQKKEKKGSFLRELPVLLLIAFVLALLIKAFLVQAFYIPSGSMEQTLQIRDRVLINKMVYRFRPPHRGDVVVFNGLDSFTPEVQVRPPANAFERGRRWTANLLGLGQPGERDFIKRVIGIPGDTVACCTNEHLTVNGVAVDEPYVFEDDKQPFPPTVVAKDRLWVMGDHRSRSSDSRANGTVPVDKVLGRAFVVIWPPSNFKGLPAPASLDRLGDPPSALSRMALSPAAFGLAGALPITALRWRLRRRRSR